MFSLLVYGSVATGLTWMFQSIVKAPPPEQNYNKQAEMYNLEMSNISSNIFLFDLYKALQDGFNIK
jgi:hypothetical protein